jgi:hypothetical protein
MSKYNFNIYITSDIFKPLRILKSIRLWLYLYSYDIEDKEKIKKVD